VIILARYRKPWATALTVLALEKFKLSALDVLGPEAIQAKSVSVTFAVVAGKSRRRDRAATEPAKSRF
jgi:hypothetical protein